MNKYRKKILNILYKKDSKVLFENFISLSLLNIISYVFPIITLPYLARVIGVSRFGEIALATAIVMYFQTAVDWGFSFTATRDIAKNREDILEVQKIFNSVMWAKLFLTFISFIILLILVMFIPFLYERRFVILITFLLVPGYALFPIWFFQGLEKMKFITIFNVVAKSIFTFSIFIFIKEENDYWLQPLFIALGYWIVGLFSLILIGKRWGVCIKRINILDTYNVLCSSFDVFINQLAPNLYNSFSTLLLGATSGSIAVGKLDAATKFLSIGQKLMSVISTVFFPFLSRKMSKHSIYASFSIILSVILAILLYCMAPIIVNVFFTNEFSDSVLILKILSFSIIFLTLSDVYGTNYLIINGLEKKLRNITLAVSLFGLLIAVPLVYYYSFIGAALTITFTRFLLGSLIFFYSKNNKI